MHKPDVLFVLTIDTEEEWLWENDFPQENCSVQNIKHIPAFQHKCEGIGIRPTYFVDYAVARDSYSQEVFKAIISSRKAEIGAHLHPWCNPPFFGKTTEAESHVINLPELQVAQKLDALSDEICQAFGTRPRSFRSGRWGISGSTLQLLASRGFDVDSSVYPFYRNEFFSCEGSPLTPYWPSYTDSLSIGNQREIIEIPVSAGFNVKHFSLADRIHSTLAKPAIAWTRSIGMLWRLGLLKKIYLSPELSDVKSMNTLIDSCLQNQHQVIHMYLHSSSLIDGATGLLNIDNAFESICERMSKTIAHLQSKANVRFCTISEAKQLLEQGYSSIQGHKEAI